MRACAARDKRESSKASSKARSKASSKLVVQPVNGSVASVYGLSKCVLRIVC